MKFHKQLNKHEPPESWGDCMRTCIACMLDRHPSEVPNFFENSIDDNGAKAWNELDRWLENQGYRTAVFSFQGDILSQMTESARNCYYILMGSSKSGNGHAVIARDNEIIFDPSWTDIGIHGPAANGCYSVMLLIDNRFAERAI